MRKFLSAITPLRVVVFLLFATILSASAVVYMDDRYLYEGIDRIDDATQGRLGLRKMRNLVLKSIDLLNPMVGATWVMKSGLPIYNLKLSSKDVQHFTNISEAFKKAGRKLDKLNVWRKAQLTVSGEAFNIKLKLHGTAADHYMYARKSFSIKSKTSINGLTRFALMRDGHRISTIFYHALMRKLGMLDVKSALVVVMINNVYQGLYILEERTNTKLLEKNNITNAAIIKNYPLYTNHFTNSHTTPYDETIFNIENKSYLDDASKRASNAKSLIFPGTSEEKIAIALAALNRLLAAIKDGDVSRVKSMIDIKQFAKAEAFRMLSGHVQYVLGDNRRLIFDFSVGKFLFFFSRPEGPPVKYNAWKFPFESQIFKLKSAPTRPVEQNYLLSFLAKDPEFRMLRNVYLQQIISMRQEIEGIYEGIAAEYGPIIYKDPSSESVTRKEKRDDVENGVKALRRNFDVLSAYLKYTRVHVIIERHRNKFMVRISADSNLPLKLKEFSIVVPDGTNGLNPILTKITGQGAAIKAQPLSVSSGSIDLLPALENERFANGLDDDFQFKLLETRYQIDGMPLAGRLGEPRISFVNAVTEETISADVTNIVIADHRSFEKPAIRDGAAIAALKNLGVAVSSNEATFPPGSYKIENTLVLPSGLNVNLRAGTQLLLGKNVSFVINGSLTATGTETEKVVISSLGEKDPFGSVVVFAQAGASCRLTYLDVSNGSEAVIDGWYSSAALYINSCATDASYLSVHDSKSEDGLNIKSSRVKISDSSFYNNYADQVDLDVTTGTVLRSKFSEGKSINGDGLDVSGSRLLLSNNQFSRFRDKGISVGEASKVVIADSRFEENRVAVAVKDASQAYMYRNRFTNNDLIVDVYIKKNIYSSPKLIWADGPVSNPWKIRVSDASLLVNRQADVDFDELVTTPRSMERLFEAAN